MMFPAVEFVPTLPWERRVRLDLGAGRGAGTGETRGRVCEVAGVGGKGFVNQKQDSTISIIGCSRRILVGSVVLHSSLPAGLPFGWSG
jgi:hypothetical protein